jgi:hypothetical protein
MLWSIAEWPLIQCSWTRKKCCNGLLLEIFALMTTKSTVPSIKTARSNYTVIWVQMCTRHTAYAIFVWNVSYIYIYTLHRIGRIWYTSTVLRCTKERFANVQILGCCWKVKPINYGSFTTQSDVGRYSLRAVVRLALYTPCMQVPGTTGPLPRFNTI